MSEPVQATAALATAAFTLRVSANPYLTHTLILEPHADPLLKTEQARGCPIAITVPGSPTFRDAFMPTSIYQGGDAVIATCAAEDLELRLTWSRAPADALRLLIQLRTTGATVVDGEIRLPLLDHVHPGDTAHLPNHDPGRGPLARDGRSLVRGGKYPLPRAWWSDRAGVAVLARMATAVGETAPYRWLTPPEVIPVRVRPQWLDVCELTIMACAPGWHGAVAALRQQLRADMDLSEYHRPDLAWYREQWLQHFTFLYGREIFDHDQQRLDVDRLLDDGQRFGGYDGLLLWPAYPRLGIDQRSQWDFYDDVPGGRTGLRDLAARARSRGTRIFIPYLPWDAPGECRHGEQPLAAQELARAVHDVDADGIFLDTIGGVPAQFRREIDRIRPGVVFCSEMQPGPQSITRITGSWDQAEHREVAEVDLQRFLFPEHPSFLINRHAIGAHRRRVIARALFNGTGLVVWQDVFGEMLPYTDAEAAQVRAAITTLRRHADCFRGADALPLVPTTDASLHANAFIAADGRAVVVAYNGGDSPAQGDLVAWTPDARLSWTQEGEDGELSGVHDVPHGTIAPGRLALFTGAARR